MLRGEEAGWLSVKIDADAEKCGNKLYYDFCQERRYPAGKLAEQIRMAVDDAYKRLLEPSITTEILKEAKQKADQDSIVVFGENLKQLLLASPVGQKRTMAIDPGFRNGCKIVCLDENGELVHHEIVYPHPPKNEKIKAITSVSSMLEKYGIQAIAIGNGTASRETEEFIKRVPLPEGCKVFVVKIDPKSLGVGQYQYDVDQALLKEKLDNTVESCVNTVGVNLNTASTYLLSYVSGIGPALAKSIVKTRSDRGGFRSRKELLKVPRLGEKAFEQCAGFLRIPGAENPLDNSAVHPECYHIVDRMAADLGVSASELVGNAQMCSGIKPEKYVEGDFGLPTVNDILKELAKPGRDPREAAQEFSFAEDIHEIEDLHEGMEIPGIVTNITAFGAFVDVGVHENGLIHVSQMGRRGDKVTLKLHQHVTVRVIGVDLDRKRISLRLVK